MVSYVKNKDFKTIFCSQGNQCYQRNVVPQVNLVIPPVVNRLISVGELRAVAITHLVELSVEHEFFATFFSEKKLSWPINGIFLNVTDICKKHTGYPI